MKILQNREELVHKIKIPDAFSVLAHSRAKSQIFFYGNRSKDLAVFGNKTNAEACDLIRFHPGDIVSLEINFPSLWYNVHNKGFEGCTLAGTIPSHEAKCLAFPYCKTDIEQYMTLAIIGVDLFCNEDISHFTTPLS